MSRISGRDDLSELSRGSPVNFRVDLSSFGKFNDSDMKATANHVKEPVLLPATASTFLENAIRKLDAAEAKRRYIDSLGLEEDVFGLYHYRNHRRSMRPNVGHIEDERTQTPFETPTYGPIQLPSGPMFGPIRPPPGFHQYQSPPGFVVNRNAVQDHFHSATALASVPYSRAYDPAEVAYPRQGAHDPAHAVHAVEIKSNPARAANRLGQVVHGPGETTDGSVQMAQGPVQHQSTTILPATPSGVYGPWTYGGDYPVQKNLYIVKAQDVQRDRST